MHVLQILLKYFSDTFNKHIINIIIYKIHPLIIECPEYNLPLMPKQLTRTVWIRLLKRVKNKEIGKLLPQILMENSNHTIAL